MSKLERANAQIERTMLGFEDHGILTFVLHCVWDGAGCGFGGYALDGVPKERTAGSGRTGHAFGSAAIRAVLETVGVSSWEELKGKYVRIESEGLGGRIKRIGHITKNIWLSLDDLAAQYR